MLERIAKPSFYRNISIFLGFVIVLFFLLALMLPTWRAGAGIAARLALAMLTFVASAWYARAKKSIWASLTLVMVGIMLLITVLLGYGFNGSPVQPWLF